MPAVTENESMSNRILEERIAALEREVAELKALLGTRNGHSEPKAVVLSASVYRERRESSRALREAERDCC
jgi:hypothetical protein